MPHTLLLRLPEPGQEDTEWLGIDDSGVPSGARQRRAPEPRCRRRALRAVVALAPATQILLAEPELPPGSGVKLARAVPFALEEQLTEDIDRVVFRASAGVSRTAARRSRWSRATCSKPGWLELAAAGIEPAALYPDISLMPENPGQTVLWLEKRAPRRAPSRRAAVRGGAHPGRGCAGGSGRHS